jgi:hypothetical protein
MSDYKITGKDIEGMLNYLKHHHPEQATEEQALAYLEWFKTKGREISVNDPTNTEIEEVYKMFLDSLL